MSQSNGNPLPIIWGALLMSQLIYLVIPEVVQMDAEPPDQIVLLGLCGVGISNAIIALVIPNLLKNQDRMSRSIIQYAFLESCSILGLVCTFLGAPSMYHYGLAFLGAGGMILLFPKKEVRGREQ